MDILIYAVLGLIVGSAVGWVACLRWHGWKFRKRKYEQDDRDLELRKRFAAVNQAEQEARQAADALRRYSSSNRQKGHSNG